MKDLPIFAGLTPAECELITSTARGKHFSDGEIIFKQRSPVQEVALLLSGSAELTFFNWISGEESTPETIAPGAFFSNYDGTTQAVEACWILVWDQPEFKKLVIQIPTFRNNVFRHHAEEIRKRREQRKKLTSDHEIALFGGPWRPRDASISPSDKMVFGWLLVGTTALLIWEIVKHAYK